jgi:hypothetical protein
MAVGRRRGSRVTTRLVAIVLIPVVGLVSFSARDATTRWRVTAGAEALAEDVDRVSTLTPVALMVASEMYLRGAIVSGRELGLDADTLGGILGLDLLASLGEAQREVDRRLAELDPSDPAQPLVAELASLRVALEDGTASLEESGIWDISQVLTESAFAALRDAQDRAAGLVASTPTQRSLAVLDATYDAASSVFSQVGALGRMAVADDGPQLRRLLEATIRLNDAHEELGRIAEGPLADQFAALADNDAVQASAAAVEGVLVAGGLQTSDPAALAGLFGAAMERLDAYYTLVVSAADGAADDARALGSDARRRAVVALAVTALLLAATIAATALIARSIGLPLRRLARSAEQVRAGDLDAVDLPTRGPREVVAVTRTLREVVDNLQVVEAQLGALHAGQLDEPCWPSRCRDASVSRCTGLSRDCHGRSRSARSSRRASRTRRGTTRSRVCRTAAPRHASSAVHLRAVAAPVIPSPCSTSTSTTSSGSTTTTGTSPVMPCCRSSPGGCSRRCEPVTSWPVSAATSSWS